MSKTTSKAFKEASLNLKSTINKAKKVKTVINEEVRLTNKAARKAARKQLAKYNKPRRIAKPINLEELLKKHGVKSTLSKEQRAACEVVGLKMNYASEHLSQIGKTNPYSLNKTHPQTLSKKQMNKLISNINIGSNGILEPIKYVEFNGQKYVVNGHHRLIAAKRLGLTEAPIEEVKLPYAGYRTIDDLLWVE